MSAVKQISVFLENTPSKLAEFTEVLQKNSINLRALSVAEAEDFGIARIIVDDVFTTATVLKSEGYISAMTDVLAVGMKDEPGALSAVLKCIGGAGINLEYMYAFTAGEKDMAYMILRVENNEKAIEVLSKNGFKPLCQEDLAKI